MKKLTGIILAIVLALSLACTAAVADEYPEPEGGKKFNSDWAVQNATAQIYYEEEGYRVTLESMVVPEGTGTLWQYSCYYMEESDTLMSISSSKVTFTFDPAFPDERTYAQEEYEGLDDEGRETVFSINEEGRLIWQDGHENQGADLEFINIGRFYGSWKNSEEKVYADFAWDGQDDHFCYNVFIQRGESDDDTYVVFHMTGVYNAETRKLECTGTAVTCTKNADGEYESSEDGETYEAFFSLTENGGILFETANGIELEPNYDSHG